MKNIELKQWFYVKRPKGRVGEEHYELRESIIEPELAKNEVLIESKYLSVDPYMRIQQAAKPTWEQPHPLNTVQGAAVVGQVTLSNSPLYKKGDWVVSYSGWQNYAQVHHSELEKLNPKEVDVKTALGVFGMPGRTAWFGLMECGKPKAGDTVLVSGAAGAVGSLVTQFALKNGCHVITIAGSTEKCEWLKSLGAHDTLNYNDFQNADELSDKINQLGGVDLYFDNVGGYITDAALMSLNLRGRVVICGQISQYDGGLDNPTQGPRLLHHLLYKRAAIQGVLARDFTHRTHEFHRIVAPWVKNNEIEFKTTEIQGFERLPAVLSSLFEGANIGKAIVKV